MTHIIPPRRNEPIIDVNGFPTLRFFEYLEANAVQTNETLEGTEVDISTVNMAMPMINDLQEQIDQLKLLVNLYGK
jgi:hypothetical protein